jgi:hypothetical protein
MSNSKVEKANQKQKREKVHGSSNRTANYTWSPVQQQQQQEQRSAIPDRRELGDSVVAMTQVTQKQAADIATVTTATRAASYPTGANLGRPFCCRVVAMTRARDSPPWLMLAGAPVRLSAERKQEKVSDGAVS